MGFVRQEQPSAFEWVPMHQRCEGGPIADAEFLVDVVEVALHRTLGHGELSRNLPVREALDR